MAASLSFAASLQTKSDDASLRVVQLDGLAVLKIIKHCKESMPAVVTGQLLGLDIGQTLEITDCFPFPTRLDDEDASDVDGASYQLDMMRCLREVNVDNNTVGWYQSTQLGNFQTVELIETFVNYQESIKRCVCIVYDPQRSSHGGLSIKAVKLKDSFIGAYKGDGVLTIEKVTAGSITWKDIFEEIPIKVHNTALSSALLAEIEPPTLAKQIDFDKLNLSVAPALEKNLEFVNDCLDDAVSEQQKVSMYHRSVARQQQQQAQWLQKRRQENAQRRAAGEDPLPEEDPQQFKPIPEPNQLDNFLITNQIATYLDQLSVYSAQSLEKLFAVEGLQRAHL
eukprot:jgi/Astpho2/4352/e_gw1.00066.13.1_t